MCSKQDSFLLQKEQNNYFTNGFSQIAGSFAALLHPRAKYAKSMSKDKQPLEILLVTLKYPPSVGGMQKQSKELIRHLESITHTHQITFSNRYPLPLFVPILLIKTCWKLLFNPGIGVIHANEALAALFLTPVMLLFSKRRFWVTVHGLDVVFKFGLYQWWIRRFLTRFEGVVAVSTQTGVLCVKAGIPENKVHWIPNACELPQRPVEHDPSFKTTLGANAKIDLSGKIILTSVGRPIPRKGFVWFIQNVLVHLPPQYVYLIAGPEQKHMAFFKFLQKIFPPILFKRICQLQGVGLEYFEMLNLQKVPGLAGRFHFLGRLSDASLQQLYAQSDLFLMPNLAVEGDFEGFGLVALEAVSQGTICLAAEVDGIPSAIQHDVNGRLLESGNPTVWIHEISRICENSAIQSEYRQRYYQSMKQFNYSWSDMSKLYFELFSK